MRLFFIINIILLLFSSCATMAKKGNYKQAITFAPAQDSCAVLVNGKFIGYSPITDTLDTRMDYTITYAKMSYLPRTFYIKSEKDKKWVTKDILAGALIFSPLTLSKDKKTKAWNELNKSEMPLELTYWQEALPPSDYLNTLFQIEDLYFASSSAKIQSFNYSKIDKLIAIFKKYPDIKVVIHGHSDKVGNEAINKDLSTKRAEAVKRYLVNKGIDPNRIITVGHGSSRPIYDGESESNFYKNRRVEFEYVL